MVTHNDHLNSQESLAAKKTRHSSPASQFDKRQQIETATAIGQSSAQRQRKQNARNKNGKNNC
jgi:hypothetical protein